MKKLVIGVPAESKTLEHRVALIPASVSELTQQGFNVNIASNAGVHSGYVDYEYAAAGANILKTSKEVYEQSRLIVKVKEPVGDEISWLTADHALFSYLHLAAEKVLLKSLIENKVLSVGFESIIEEDGTMPLLAPMSNIAGRLAVQTGATLLQTHNGGKGILLGGLPAAPRGNVVIVGAGVAGMNAAYVAAGLGANVTVFDLNHKRLEAARNIGPNVTALHSFPADLQEAVSKADLVIGAVLIPGKTAPKVITESMIKSMENYGVVVDISVDQGGCVETTRATTYESPVYIKHGILHFAVTNMPGAVGRTASQVLSAAITPYIPRVNEVASERWGRFDDSGDTIIKSAINTSAGLHADFLQEYV